MRTETIEQRNHRLERKRQKNEVIMKKLIEKNLMLKLENGEKIPCHITVD